MAHNSLITGIGLATAALFVDEGAKVLITGQDQARVQQAVDPLEAAATGICTYQTSLSDLATQVEEHFDQLNILFLNAGVTMPAVTINESESHLRSPRYCDHNPIGFGRMGNRRVISWNSTSPKLPNLCFG